MADRIYDGSIPAEWPFPVKYGVENRIETDVLIIGAGIAGAMAGLMAARRGVKVAVVDKAPIDISGSGGAGLDHYGGCISNPSGPFTPEEYMALPQQGSFDGRGRDFRSYIQMKGSWDNLMELEKLGLHFRDEEDEFAGAPFRDDKTKIMYAYDYKTKDTIRLRGGAHIKKVVREGLTKEKNASLFERVMITSLLTEDGKQGARIVGATGLHEETGEFYIFSAKCVIISTAGVSMQGTSTWTYNLEMFGNGFRNDPNCTGDGVAMAWKAGANVESEQASEQDCLPGPSAGPGMESATRATPGIPVPWWTTRARSSPGRTLTAKFSRRWPSGPSRLRASPIWACSAPPPILIPSSSRAVNMSSPCGRTYPPCRTMSAAPSGASWSGTRAERASPFTIFTTKPASTRTRICSSAP